MEDIRDMEDIREMIREIVRDELKNNNRYVINGRKKREPTKWNIFLGECSKKIGKEKSMSEKAKICSIQYKKIKEMKMIKSANR